MQGVGGQSSGGGGSGYDPVAPAMSFLDHQPLGAVPPGELDALVAKMGPPLSSAEVEERLSQADPIFGGREQASDENPAWEAVAANALAATVVGMAQLALAPTAYDPESGAVGFLEGGTCQRK